MTKTSLKDYVAGLPVAAALAPDDEFMVLQDGALRRTAKSNLGGGGGGDAFVASTAEDLLLLTNATADPDVIYRATTSAGSLENGGLYRWNPVTLAIEPVGSNPTSAGSFASLTGLPTDNVNLSAALATKVPTTQLAVANGVATLGADGRLSPAQIPDSIQGLSPQGTWNAATNTPTIPTASGANRGWFWLVSVDGSTNISGITTWNVGDMLVNLNGTAWDRVPQNVQLVDSVAGKTGVVTLNKTDVGLGNVDNTADADKPVSDATQTALNAKQPLATRLTGIAALTSTGLIESTSSTASTIRAIGTAAGTSIPTLQDADSRFTKWTSGAPSGGVDNDVAMRRDGAFFGRAYVKTAGVWGTSPSFTWAAGAQQIPAASSTYLGCVVYVNDLNEGVEMECIQLGAGYYWVPLNRYLPLVLNGEPTPFLTGNSTTQSCATNTIPAGLAAVPHCRIRIGAYFECTGTATKTPEIRLGGLTSPVLYNRASGANCVYIGIQRSLFVNTDPATQWSGPPGSITTDESFGDSNVINDWSLNLANALTVDWRLNTAAANTFRLRKREIVLEYPQ